MIHHYAVEPQALGRENTLWQALESCGYHHGRVIAEFPSRWQRQVYEAMDACDCPDVEKKRLTERLTRLKKALVRAGCDFDAAMTWRDNATDALTALSLRAVVQTDNPNASPLVLTPVELHEENPLWVIQRQQVVPRSAAAIAASVAPLLRLSRELLFVDPYYSGERRWNDVIGTCLRQCELSDRGIRRIELHTASAIPMNTLRDKVERWVVRDIPRSHTLKVVRWEPIPGGDRPHARYVLTDRGGIFVDSGLDEGDAGTTTNIGLLDREMHLNRWNDFQSNSTTYRAAYEFSLQGIRA